MSEWLVREADDLCKRLDAKYRCVTGPVIPGQPVPDHRDAPRLARLRARAWDRYVRRWMVTVDVESELFRADIRARRTRS